MRLMLIAACLLLAACAAAPAQIVVTGAAGDMLPAEAQRVIDRATATAGAVATQAAQATATEQSARATSTSAYRMTQDALVLEQTRSALQLTQAAGAALATDAAAVKTQAAAWTAAAVGTQAAADQARYRAEATQAAAGAARAAASAQAVIDVAGAIGLAALLTALAIGAVIVYWQNERQKIKTDTLELLEAERVEQARAATQRALAEAIRASTIDLAGAPHLITARGYVPLLPAATLAVPHPNQGQAWRWRVAIRKAVQAGLVLGELADGRPQFGERDLAGPDSPWIVNPDGTPSSVGYRKINRVLRHLEIWITAGRDTVWAPGWGAERFEREFDGMPLPVWLYGAPPEVRTVLRSSAVSAVPQFRTEP